MFGNLKDIRKSYDGATLEHRLKLAPLSLAVRRRLADLG